MQNQDQEMSRELLQKMEIKMQMITAQLKKAGLDMTANLIQYGARGYLHSVAPESLLKTVEHNQKSNGKMLTNEVRQKIMPILEKLSELLLNPQLALQPDFAAETSDDKSLETQILTTQEKIEDRFTTEVLALFPNNPKVKEYLEAESGWIGRYLDDASRYTPSPDTIIDAFANGQQDILLQSAKKAKKAQELLEEWKRRTAR